MASPIHHLPVLQNWDCHVCGTCCQEYQVTITDEERQRIEAQGWDRDADLGGREPFIPHGRRKDRRYRLNHREDDSCVFLSEQGRCRIHERFGYETKPLACRLFPFVLVPVADEWRVGVRFACPSVANNKGRPLAAHNASLTEFANRLAEREGLTRRPDGSLTPPPPLEGRPKVEWPEMLRLVDVLLGFLRNRRDPIERRLRKCLALAESMRALRLDRLDSRQLREVVDVMAETVDQETTANPMMVPPPGWVGRILFRQAAALFTRKDHGPKRGLPGRGRVVLFRAACRFTRGRGPVPRMHQDIPPITFEELEVPRGPLPVEVEEILERYYTLKVGSLQFCGAASFGLPFWEGFEMLALTFPILLWVARAFRERPRQDAIMQALSIVDDHVGFNPVLATRRQRLSFRILARRGELARLIAWYSR
ncbi:MAG TPA: YkgJ family cysteine cluster protein [Gemmataceae bacterium]|nr:YkgJ family cysteine cluster protein [Gemmataceae bacterium]